MASKLGCIQIPKYIGALIKLLQWHWRGIDDLIPGMVKVEL